MLGRITRHKATRQDLRAYRCTRRCGEV